MVGLVAVIAVAGPRATSRPRPWPIPSPPRSHSPGRWNSKHFAAAAAAYGEAASQRPDEEILARQAFALIRAGRPDEAASIAARVLSAEPDNSDALLMLGLAQRATGSAQAAATLRRFLRVAPNHPAASEISGLVSGS
jgi:Flp pilus assembly protein TadD